MIERERKIEKWKNRVEEIRNSKLETRVVETSSFPFRDRKTSFLVR